MTIVGNESKTQKQLLDEIDELQWQLKEANSIISAIREGEVDALLISQKEGEQVYILHGADYVYREVIEEMQEGYITLGKDGVILFSNRNFAQLLHKRLEQVIGMSIYELLSPVEGEVFHRLLTNNKERFKREFSIKAVNGISVPVLVSVNYCFGEHQFAYMIVTDLTEQKRSEQRFMHRVFDQAAEAFIVCDVTGQIVRVNRVGTILFETEILEGFFDQTIPLYWEKDGRPFSIKDVIREGNINGIEARYTNRTGKNFALSVSVGLLTGMEPKETIGFLVTLADITDRKKAQAEIVLAMERAEVANAAKSQFLANMSHEIRTPMNGIIGMTDIALMTDLQEEQREYLMIVKASTIALLRVLNDILDYSKIEAGKMDLEIGPLNLQNIMREVVELFDISAKQKGLYVTFKIDKRIPNQIIGDSVRLRQVISNLLGNGIKFTNHGGIRITVVIEEQFSHKIKLKFMIKDTGIGIAEDKLDRLFKRFSQVDDSHTRQFGGTGLGLAISKKIIEMLDGEIGVESKENIGSMFFFTVVFRLQEGGVKVIDCAHNESIQYTNPKNRKVLVAEDDPVSRNMIALILRGKGIEVIAVEDGKQAFTAFEQEKFDLILMDISMPYFDGYAVTSMIRLKEKNVKFPTPIIAMTAHALKGDQERCLAAGMDDYISKPIDLKGLIELINKWLIK